MPRSDQGVHYDRYAVIPRVLVFIFKNDSVLLLRGSPTKRIWPNRYNGIGGHIERGEDVLSAAKREVLEETGLSPASFQLTGTVMVDSGEERGIGLYIFRADYQTGDLQESAEGRLEWVPMDRLAQQDLVEDLPEILPRVYRMKRGDAPFSALYRYDLHEKLIISFGD